MCLKKVCSKLEIEDYQRVRWFFGIFIICIVLLIVFTTMLKCKIFYYEPTGSFLEIYRFIWVLPYTFIGFSFLALLVAVKKKSKDNKPWISFIFNYFPRLIALSLIIFSVLHLFEATSGYLYYFLSAGIGIYLGYNIDFVKLEDLIKKN